MLNHHRMICAAVLGLFLVCSSFGCSRSAPEPSAAVPVDCRQLLDKYFEAVKAKDIGKIQDVSSYIPLADRKNMDERGLDMMLESKKKLTADGIEAVLKKFGDFQSYSVSGVKVTTATESDPEPKVLAAGIHAEIAGKAEFSNQKSVRFLIHLFKETQESEYYILTWNYEAEL